MHENIPSVDTDEIADFLYSHLINIGLAPTEEETLIIADILFDFLVFKGFIVED